MHLVTQYRDRADVPKAHFPLHLERLRPVIEWLAAKDPTLDAWFLKGDTVEEAGLYRVFGGGGPTTAAVAVLSERYRMKVGDPKTIAIWNGETAKQQGAALSVTIDTGIIANELELSLGEVDAASSRLGEAASIAELVTRLVALHDPAYITFGPRKYVSKQVFDYRPGASWMLYLPHTLTVSDVPEAGALIRIVGPEGKKQMGTLIVSITEGVFDVKNPAHIEAANAIEVRLANQDLLPRYTEL